MHSLASAHNAPLASAPRAPASREAAAVDSFARICAQLADASLHEGLPSPASSSPTDGVLGAVVRWSLDAGVVLVEMDELCSAAPRISLPDLREYFFQFALNHSIFLDSARRPR